MNLTCRASLPVWRAAGPGGLVPSGRVGRERVAASVRDGQCGAGPVAGRAGAGAGTRVGATGRDARRAAAGDRGRQPVLDLNTSARLHTAEACAHAIAGDARRCTAALRLAEDATAKASGTDQPAWAGYFTPAHLAGTAIRCLRDLGRTAEALRWADQALELGEGSVRTRALHTALIASVYATGSAPDPEHAGHLGHDALDLAGRVRSRRVTDRITDLTQRLSAYRGNPVVDAFLRRAGDYVSPAPRG